MKQVEIILRTRENSGRIREQILMAFSQEHMQQRLYERERWYIGLCIDPAVHKISYEGKSVPLSEMEYQLLLYLSSQPNRVFTKEQIYQQIWKLEPVNVDNAVCCTISSIRRKFRRVTKKEYIKTIWGVGYKFVDFPGE